MKISVTQDNINYGLRGSCTSDPVALALQDAGFLSPHVGANEIRVKNGAGQSVPTPDSVLHFLRQFDNGLPVEPTVFEIGLR